MRVGRPLTERGAPISTHKRDERCAYFDPGTRSGSRWEMKIYIERRDGGRIGVMLRFEPRVIETHGRRGDVSILSLGSNTLEWGRHEYGDGPENENDQRKRSWKR